MNTLTTVSDRNKTTGVRAAVLLALIQSHPNSRSNHLALTHADIEVYDSPVEGVGAFVETQDMETYLHVVSVVTREAAMTGYSVQINQHGWDVGFIFTESVYTEPEVETEWVIIYADSPDSTAPLYFDEDNGWTPLRERAVAFGSRAVAENYLDAVLPTHGPRTFVREEVAK